MHPISEQSKAAASGLFLVIGPVQTIIARQAILFPGAGLPALRPPLVPSPQLER